MPVFAYMIRSRVYLMPGPGVSPHPSNPLKKHTSVICIHIYRPPAHPRCPALLPCSHMASHALGACTMSEPPHEVHCAHTHTYPCSGYTALLRGHPNHSVPYLQYLEKKEDRLASMSLSVEYDEEGCREWKAYNRKG